MTEDSLRRKTQTSQNTSQEMGKEAEPEQKWKGEHSFTEDCV